jgi:CSLREA domain-containing protein
MRSVLFHGRIYMIRLLTYALIVATLLSFDARSVAAATFTVNSAADTHDANPGDGICGDSAAGCSFRAAVEEASALPGSDTVRFERNLGLISLVLGPVLLAGNGTVVIGNVNESTIDGLGNPFASAAIEIRSDSNTIYGLIVQRSRGNGIRVAGAYNQIGAADSTRRNHIMRCGLDFGEACGISITGAGAAHNTVTGNNIGTSLNGAVSLANANGIGLDNGAHDNVIGGTTHAEGNLISGNSGRGLIIRGGAHNNSILGNSIGTDPSGSVSVANGLGGVLIDSRAHDNAVGTEVDSSGNLISGNGVVGLQISGGGTSGNSACSNYIGTDFSGRLMLGNSGPGVLISDGAAFNRIGGCPLSAGNLISGNAGDGVQIMSAGTNNNTIAGNYIGLDVRGYGDLSNGMVDGDGIRIGGGAQYNIIGGTNSDRNVIAGNLRFGIYVTDAGTSHNRISGNYIGTTNDGLNVLSNGSGIVIRHGASDNVIGGSGFGEGNVISGNRDVAFPFGAGVVIYDVGSDGNAVEGNFIGTDVSGTRSIRNGTSGVVIGEGASDNIVGGSLSGEGNVISGNGTGSLSVSLGRGVHIFGEGTRNNQVVGNVIGMSVGERAAVPNNGNAVAVVGGASENQIGGENPESGNLIAWNHASGILMSDTATNGNLIRYNRMFSNDSLGISIMRRAQNNIAPPTLFLATVNGVTGTAEIPGSVVDVYLAAPDKSGSGEGREWIAGATVATDGNFATTLNGVLLGDTLTAIVTDPAGNSSAFAQNIVVEAATNTEESNPPPLVEFGLSQNYPNPCNPSTVIEFSLARPANVMLSICNVLGQQVAALCSGVQAAGSHRVTWDGTDLYGHEAASGVYIYRIKANGAELSRKLILLR